MLLGYLLEYPDYMTQGNTPEELQKNLREIYQDLTSGAIPCVQKVAALKEYMTRKKQLQILDLFGTVKFDPKFDYKQARK